MQTDSYEVVDPRDYEQLGKQMDNRRFNGSSKFINSMLTLIVLLLVAAIAGQIRFNTDISERVGGLEATLRLVIEGHLK